MSKYRKGTLPQMSCDLIFQNKQGPSFYTTFQKYQKVGNTFFLLLFLNSSFQTDKKKEKKVMFFFFYTNRSVEVKPPIKCVNILVDLEPCIKYGGLAPG